MRGLLWQDIAVVHPPALADGKMLANCVLRRPTVARSRCGAFPGGDPWQLFRFMRSRRGLGREKRQFVATYRRHVSKTSRLRQDIRAMHPKSPANGRSGMHRANILPRRGPFRCAGPSHHARREDLAIPRCSFERFDLFRVGWGGARGSRTALALYGAVLVFRALSSFVRSGTAVLRVRHTQLRAAPRSHAGCSCCRARLCVRRACYPLPV